MGPPARLVWLLALLAAAAPPAARSSRMEDELRCSACEAVAAELQRRLDAELPRTHLDMRHRLDKDGQRYGKIIDYKVSEIRAVELTEDLCEEMDAYTVIQQQQKQQGQADAASGSSEAAAAAAPPPQLVWVKRRGEGSVKVKSSQRPPKAEERQRVKQLQTFCGLLLEKHEDAVHKALVTDAFAAHGVAPVLCQRISSVCQGKSYEPAAAAQPAAEQGGGESAAGSGKQEL